MPDKNNTNHLPPFILAMLKPEFYAHPVKNCRLIETHISWVILTGDYVYKIKKPVNLGFVDFSTLAKRKFYCEEELRLNRRLAPNLYLDVISLSGTEDNPELNGNGNVFEYAVRMRQFLQEMQLDQVLARSELRQDMIDSLAKLIADFHQQITVAGINDSAGKPEQVYQPVKENFIQIRQRIHDKSKIDLLVSIEQWSDKTFNQISNILAERKQKGFIRECHGDLHLRNLAWYNNKPLAFDCLEFNPNFRWIDVISEVAFLVMDLEDHKQPELAQRFLNRYLEYTGDYPGCQVLQFYLSYRAMVRAKVAAIRLAQKGISQEESDAAREELDSYLKLALSYTKQKKSFVIITRGMSASGKSTLTQPLLEKTGAIRVRSDIERKRIFGITPGQDAHAEPEQGIYSREATLKTYIKLLALSETIIDAGLPVIVDATFSTAEQRQLFKELAVKKHVRYIILEFIATEETLKQRIRERKRDVSDADIDVLENQIKNWRPLEENEKNYSISVDTEKAFDLEKLVSLVRKK